MGDNQSIFMKNAKILKDMAEQVIKRRGFIDENKKIWKNDWYVRVSPSAFRAVSLNNETPLKGFTNGDRKDISNGILKDFQKGKPKVPKKPVPERRVQCWLIKYALNNSMDLKQILLPRDSFCEKLLFCLDEVTLYDENIAKQVRCDMLAVAIHGKEAFPVVIEIKSDHVLKDAVKELTDFCKILGEHSLELDDLLLACLGQLDIEFIDHRRTAKMIIWNREDGISKSTRDKLEENNISLCEYQWKLDFHNH